MGLDFLKNFIASQASPLTDNSHLTAGQPDEEQKKKSPFGKSVSSWVIDLIYLALVIVVEFGEVCGVQCFVKQ